MKANLLHLLPKSLVLSGLMLGGCVAVGTPPEYVEPQLGIELPETWGSGTEAQPVDGSWWSFLEDPVLSALVEEALASNHDLKQAAARLEIAAAQARIAGAVLYPTLEAGLNGQRQAQNFSALPVPGVGSGAQSVVSNSFGVSLNFRWELDIWGRLRSGARAAAADLQAEHGAYRAASLSLAAQAAKAWYALTEARLQLRLAQQTVASFADTFRQATDRSAAGIQAPVDEHLAQANLAAAQASLQVRAEVFSRSAKQLEILLGRYPSAELEGAAELAELTQSIPTGIPAGVIRRRADVGTLERQLAATLQRIDASKAALYPRLTLTGSAGSSTSEFKDLLSGDFFVWNIAGGLVQPLFEGGRLRAEVQLAEGRAGAAASAFAQGVLEALFEVEASLALERFLAGQEAALIRATAASKQAVEISGNRYSQGIETLLVVLESQRRALDAESSLLSVRRARLDARLDLHLALGGGLAAHPSEVSITRAERGAFQ